MLPSNGVGNDQKRGSLKEQYFVSIKDTGEVAQATLQLGDVGDQQVNNVGPRLREKKREEREIEEREREREREREKQRERERY